MIGDKSLYITYRPLFHDLPAYHRAPATIVLRLYCQTSSKLKLARQQRLYRTYSRHLFSAQLAYLV